MADVKGAEDDSLFLLHACAHNPTGVDPTPEQWAELSQLMKDKKHTVFFDCAYQVSTQSKDRRAIPAVRTLGRGVQASASSLPSFARSRHA